MKILFIGDVVGKLGRQAVAKVLPELKKKYGPDVILANGENLAHGRGATRATIDEVLAAGVDYLTGGNHVFWQADIIEDLQNGTVPLLRPENYPLDTPGKGYTVVDLGKSGKLLIISLQGRDFIEQPVDSPLRTLDRVLEETAGGYTVSVVDFHAEATAEKLALGFYADGRVSAVLGTHTHVPTADTRLLPQGTAYVSDVGMTGPRDSVLGVKKEIIVQRMLSPLPQRFEWVEEGPAVFQSVLVEAGSGNKAQSIVRIDYVLS